MESTIQGNILIVDDTQNNLRLLMQILTDHGHRVRPAISGEIALNAVKADLPDLILLDIVMPEMDGFEVCRKLKADDETKDVPILFISALNEIEDKIKAFSEGGVDYVSKPFHMEEILARVNTHLTLRFQQRALAKQNEELRKKNALIEQQTENLRLLASQDPLTGLSNRRCFLENARQEEERCKRNPKPFTIIMVDIDHFKQVNDTHGHDCGDNVLVGVAQSLKKVLRGQDVVARWGGEEFICLLPETDQDGAMIVAEKIRENIAASTYDCNSGEVAVTATLGVSVFNESRSLDECINQADVALYQGKKKGRNQVRLTK